MIARYLELAERIRGEAPELERAMQRALAAWAQAERMPQEDAYLDSVALNLHSFYSGLERLFELHDEPDARQDGRLVVEAATARAEAAQRVTGLCGLLGGIGSGRMKENGGRGLVDGITVGR